MNVFERLKKIRKYRELTQEDMAKVFKISGASYGRKEKGSEGGLGPAEIKLFLEKTQIDPRYLFGLTDDIEEADLVKNPVSRSLREEIQGLKEAFNKKMILKKTTRLYPHLFCKREITWKIAPGYSIIITGGQA